SPLSLHDALPIYERKPGLAVVAVARLSHGTGDRVEEKRAIVGRAVVIAGRAEAEREDQDQEGRREGKPRRIEERRVERRQVRSPLVVLADPGRPRGVDAEAAEHERREQWRHPPGIAPLRRAQTALLQVSQR